MHRFWHSLVIVGVFSVLLSGVIAAGQLASQELQPQDQDTASLQSPPVDLTAQEDHQRLMKLLGIESLRRGANGSNPQADNAANYDESKANPFPTLPDVLKLRDDTQVTSAEVWWQKRRPEIVEDFDREIYGRLPSEMPAVKWEVVSQSEEVRDDIPVIVKQLAGRVDNSAYPLVEVTIGLTLTVPANASDPVPVIMQFSWAGFGRGGGGNARGGRGRGGLEGELPQDTANTQNRGRGGPFAQRGPSWQSQVLSRGWGYAQLDTSSVQRDNGGGLTQGIIGLVNKGQPRGVEDWGVLRAWAWGASKAVDYFEADDSVDANRVGVEGHSRWGKAALVAMAYDQRIATGYISSSGAGGAKLHRRNYGELVENVAASGEYHWMAGNYLKYAGPLSWDDLPVDAHSLIALCAPRPVFISAGNQGDSWVDPKGMFMAAAAAGPVYELLGKRGLGTTEFPAIETGLMDGELSYRQHNGGHTDGPNWPTFLDFAARYFAASDKAR